MSASHPTDARGFIDHRIPIQRALVIHPHRTRERGGLRRPESRLEEAQGLARALDLDIVAAELVPLRQVTPATLIGGGKVADFGRTLAAEEIDVVVIDDALTPVQQRNLEKAWQAKVIDRTGLILEIFARRARTREGKLQVELARLAYERSRLVRTWTHLERQRGGFGVMGGPGETQIETDRRLLADKIDKLKKELGEVRRTRTLHRTARRRTPYPTIALVGYTNAGKSTLFNRLTEAEVLAKDMLFATLDPTLRELKLPGGRPAILSDTVGFISDLPHELVEAFRATLEEVEEADIVLHVRDIAGETSAAEAADVAEVLADLGFDPDDRRLIEVWNKIDRLPQDDHAVIRARASRSMEGGGVEAWPVSALSGEGCDALLARLTERVDQAPPMAVVLQPGDGEAAAWLYRHGRVTDRTDDEAGVLHLIVRLDPRAQGRFERLFPQVHTEAAKA